MRILQVVSLLYLFSVHNGSLAEEVEDTCGEDLANFERVSGISISITEPLSHSVLLAGDGKFQDKVQVSIDIDDEAAAVVAGKHLMVCVAIDHRFNKNCIPVNGNDWFTLPEPPPGTHVLQSWAEITSETPHKILSFATPVSFTIELATSVQDKQKVAPQEPTILKTWLNEDNLPEVQLGVVLGTDENAEEAAASWKLGDTPNQAAAEFCTEHLGDPSENEHVQKAVEACTTGVSNGLWGLKPTRQIISQLNPKPRAYAEIGIGWGATALHVYEELEPGSDMYLFGYSNEVNATLERFEIWMQQRQARGLPDRGIRVHPMRNSHQPRDSYAWTLARMLSDTDGNCLDYVFLDGSHDLTIETASFAFIDRLLRPGGWIEFDDYSWTHEYSSTVVGFDSDADQQYTKEQTQVAHVKVLVDLLVKTSTLYTEIVPGRLYQKKKPGQ